MSLALNLPTTPQKKKKKLVLRKITLVSNHYISHNDVLAFFLEIDIVFLINFKMVKSAYTYQVFSRLKSTFWVLQNQLTRYTSSHNSPYAIVTPKKVSSQRSVPSHIQKPPYVSTTPGKDACPPHIEIYSPEQISKIKEACILARKILNLTAKKLKVGITTDNIDEIVHQLCIDNNVYPSPLGYLGYPKSVCTSINNVACHGIPDSRPLQDSDIINIDVTVYANGYHGDVSETYLIGNVDDRGRKLVDTTRQCLMESIVLCRPGARFGEIGRRISDIASAAGFCVIPDFCGHGIGTYFHGLPDIFHIDLGDNAQMEKGMVFTIEPVICDGKPDIKILPDGWTALTKDNSRSAQFEHCIAIIENGAEILTL